MPGNRSERTELPGHRCSFEAPSKASKAKSRAYSPRGDGRRRRRKPKLETLGTMIIGAVLVFAELLRNGG